MIQLLLNKKEERGVNEADKAKRVKNAVNVEDKDGQTPLFYAAAQGNVEAATLILTNGANLDHRDANGENAIHQAVKFGDPYCVHALLEEAKNEELRHRLLTSKNDAGLTPLDMAIQNCHYSVGMLLARSQGIKNVLDIAKKEKIENEKEIEQRNPTLANNLKIAKEALSYVRREVYEPNFKSNNKRSTKRSLEYELYRMSMANKYIDAIRALPNHSPEQKEAAYHARGHNCADLAWATEFVIKNAARLSFSADLFIAKQGECSKFIDVNDGNHSYVAVGDDIPPELPVNMADWPANIAISDAWTNIACPSQDYPKEFFLKMLKWEDRKILLDRDSNEVSPVSLEWIDLVLNSKKWLY